MYLRDLIDETFQDYKKASMFICTPTCSGKCWKELNLPANTCQNTEIMRQPLLYLEDKEITKRYLNNPITEAVVLAGLEPLDSWIETVEFIETFRKYTTDILIIYTGYNEEEVTDKINYLKEHFTNIIVKFGRYVPNTTSRFDDVLGVTLASSNQYAIKIC